MNHKVKGEISEACILARLVKLGIPVSLPWGDNQRYDMVIELDGKLLKAQCKSSRIVGNNIVFNAFSTHPSTGKHTSYYGQVDILLVYNQTLDKVYMLYLDDLKDQLQVTLQIIADKSKVRKAADYEI